MSNHEKDIRQEIQPLESLRVLVSVSDRDGIVGFIHHLQDLLPTRVVATGGTGQYLHEAGIEATLAEEITGFPHLLDGRIKMLHGPIFAAILADQQNPEHLRQLEKMGIEPFDMVVVNLYPFKQTVQSGAVWEEVIEKIDVGGPAALRAAAKNYPSVIVVCSPEEYPEVIKMLQEQGNLSFDQRKMLAEKAFRLTEAHDKEIIDYLSSL